MPIALLLAFALLTGAAAVAQDAPATPKPPIIILKLDDVVASNEGGGPVSPRWQRVIEYVQANKLKAAGGIIGYALEQDNPPFFAWIKQQHAAGVEFWLHGHHRRLATDKAGEFEEGTAAEQAAILARVEALAKEKLGFDLAAFGPHWSGTTEATDQALQDTPQVKIWLYGPARPKHFQRLSIPRVMALENPTFVPDPDKFSAIYEKTGHRQPVLVLQGHPDAWRDPARWEGFTRIIAFLQAQGCTFMTPSEYAQSLLELR